MSTAWLLLYLGFGSGAVRRAALALGDHLLLALVGGVSLPVPAVAADAGEVDPELLGGP
jgi:hypothetical protein